MTTTRIRPNYRGISELARSSGVRDDLTDRAERILTAARANAPVLTGNYRDSLRIEQDTTKDGATARVVSDVKYAMSIEANDGVLARALDAAR